MKIPVHFNDIKRVKHLITFCNSFAVDTETNGLKPYQGTRLVGISFYFPDVDETHYLSFRHGVEADNLNELELVKLRAVWNQQLEERNPQVVYFNALFDMHIMIQDGFHAPLNCVEVMVSAKLLNENEHYSNNEQVAGAYKLKRLAPKYLGSWAGEGEQDLIDKAKQQGLDPKSQMWVMSGKDVAYYAGLDTYITYKLYEFYKPYLKAWGLETLEAEENKFLRDFLFRAEFNGVKIDKDTLIKLWHYEQGRVNRIQRYLDETLTKTYVTSKKDKEIGIKINLDSPAQVLKWLRDSDSTVKATDTDTLSALHRKVGNKSELGKKLTLLKTYRDANTPIKLYYKKYPDNLDDNDIMHPNHFVGGAKTGRLTCSNPNTQQISKKGKFKKVFIARSADYWHVSVDLSQAELRVATHYCQEPTMTKLMREGQDLHTYTANALTDMLNRPIDRQLGKMANFGFLYRMSPAKASIKFGIDLDLATDLVYGWRELYKNFELGYYSALNTALQWRKADGSQGTPFAPDSFQYFRLPYDERIRHFDEASRIRKRKEQQGLWDVYKGGRYNAFGEVKTAKEDMVLFPYDEHYKAFNFLIQGTIQAVMRKGILNLLTNYYPDNGVVKPKMSVYDSVIFDVKKSELNQFADTVKKVFYFDDFTIPLTVDVEYGYNYKEMQAL